MQIVRTLSEASHANARRVIWEMALHVKVRWCLANVDYISIVHSIAARVL